MTMIKTKSHAFLKALSFDPCIVIIFTSSCLCSVFSKVYSLTHFKNIAWILHFFLVMNPIPLIRAKPGPGPPPLPREHAVSVDAGRFYFQTPREGLSGSVFTSFLLPHVFHKHFWSMGWALFLFFVITVITYYNKNAFQ